MNMLHIGRVLSRKHATLLQQRTLSSRVNVPAVGAWGDLAQGSRHTARHTANLARKSARRLFSTSSTIPVTQVASVLMTNVENETTAVKFDTKMKIVTEMMKEHEGFSFATRQVCKTEWAYELQFVFGDVESFKAWPESKTREKVHAFYLDALKDCGLEEDAVKGGARVYDKW